MRLPDIVHDYLNPCKEDSSSWKKLLIDVKQRNNTGLT